MTRTKALFLILILLESAAIVLLLNRIAQPSNSQAISILGHLFYKSEDTSNEDINVSLSACIQKTETFDDIRLKPNCKETVNYGDSLIKPFNITINSDGLRDYEYSIQKPKDAYRIAFIGDSVVFGWGVELNESIPKVLEGMLRDNVSKNIEVLNFGVPAYNTQMEYNRLARDVLKYDPDMVIIGYHYNDVLNMSNIFSCMAPIWRSQNSTSLRELQVQAEKESICYMREWQDVSSKSTEDAWSIVSEPLDGVYNLSKSRGFSVVVVLSSVDYSESHPFKDMLKGDCEKYGFLFLDTTGYFRQITNGYLDLQKFQLENDPHPNPTGDRLLAEQVYNGIKEKVVSDIRARGLT